MPLAYVLDRSTLPGHLAAHVQAGGHCPGIFLIRPGSTIAQIVDYLTVAAYAADPAALRDQYEFIP